MAKLPSLSAQGGPGAETRWIRRGPAKRKPSHLDSSREEGSDRGAGSSGSVDQGASATRHSSGCAPLGRWVHGVALRLERDSDSQKPADHLELPPYLSRRLKHQSSKVVPARSEARR